MRGSVDVSRCGDGSRQAGPAGVCEAGTGSDPSAHPDPVEVSFKLTVEWINEVRVPSLKYLGHFLTPTKHAYCSDEPSDNGVSAFATNCRLHLLLFKNSVDDK